MSFFTNFWNFFSHLWRIFDLQYDGVECFFLLRFTNISKQLSNKVDAISPTIFFTRQNKALFTDAIQRFPNESCALTLKITIKLSPKQTTHLGIKEKLATIWEYILQQDSSTINLRLQNTLKIANYLTNLKTTLKTTKTISKNN